MVALYYPSHSLLVYTSMESTKRRWFKGWGWGHMLLITGMSSFVAAGEGTLQASTKGEGRVIVREVGLLKGKHSGTVTTDDDTLQTSTKAEGGATVREIGPLNGKHARGRDDRFLRSREQLNLRRVRHQSDAPRELSYGTLGRA
jgi:hypothetical protein